MAASSTSIYEIIAGGAAPTALETLPAGWTFDAIFEAGAFIYALCINTSDVKSEVHIYGLNTGLTAIEKKGQQEFPQGQLCRSGMGYLNMALLGAGKKNTSGGFDPVLYLAQPDDDGFLQYVKLAEETGSGSADLTVRAFTPLGESVIFGWSTGASSAMGAARGGLGVFHLPTEAFSYYLRCSTAANSVRSVFVYNGRVIVSLTGVGAYYEDVANLVPTATLYTSTADWNNAGRKLWDSIEISHSPLVADTRVKVYRALEVPTATTTWNESFISDTVASDGKSVKVSRLFSRLFALKIVSEADTGKDYAPEVLGFSVNSNPYPAIPEFSLMRFVRLSDVDKKENRAEEVRQDASGLLTRLLNTSYSWVKLYEPGVTWLVRVESVGVVEPSLAPFDPSGSNSRDFYVVQLSMSGTLS
jgi:hypothetical protein